MSQNKGKKVVVIQGLGYVGAVMAVVCANAIKDEYAVLGVDLPNRDSFWKINSLNNGEFPLIAEDPKIEQYYRNALHKGNIYATCDDYAYYHADIVMIDIGLDVQITKSQIVKLQNMTSVFQILKMQLNLLQKNARKIY